MSELVGEYLFIMAIPVALKTFLGIVLLFQAKEIYKLRITRFNLLPRGPAVISKIIPSVELDCPVNDSPKIFGGLFLSFFRVAYVKITDNANRRLPGPGQKALVILFNESNCAIGHINVVFEKILA